MKIIHLVLGKANPDRMNGVNKVVNSLVSHQVALGQEVALWGITHTPEAPLPNRNYPTKLFPALKHKLWLHPSLKKAVQSIQEPTIFHLHGGFIPEFYHFANLLKRYQIPYVHTAHGAYNKVAMQRNYWIKKIYFTTLEKSLLRDAQYLHFIGESELKAIHQLMNQPTCSLIPNGQQMPQSSQVAVKKTSSAAPIFGFCGRLDIHTKGLDLLMKAFAEYRQHQPFAKLWIIGDSPQRLVLEKMVQELKLEQEVVFWGKQFGAEKDELFQQIDFFFHPSRNEGMPGAVLEAAAMGIPCVVSQESNVGSYIEKHAAGKCLAMNDPEHLSQAMLAMHQVWEVRAAYQQMQQNARHMIETEFDWHKIAQQHIEQYYRSTHHLSKVA